MEAAEPAKSGEEQAEAAKDQRPLLFISHKHTDKAIAKVIENFVTTMGGGRVRVYVSSDPGSEGPGIGQSLTQELRTALWDAGAVILIYTYDAYDWSYCMWECGLATVPNSPETHVYVLQCGNDVPKPFADKVRVRVRVLDDIEKFVKPLLTKDGFFPGHPAMTVFSPNSANVSNAAKNLFNALDAVLPEEGPPHAWPAGLTCASKSNKSLLMWCGRINTILPWRLPRPICWSTGG